MTRFRNLSLFFTTIILIATISICAGAQAPEGASSSASPNSSKSTVIALSIAIPKTPIPVGQTPWVSLSVKNLSNEAITYPKTRVYVEGEKGEPPTKLRQRQLTHRRRQGEPSILGGGFEPTIQPGDSFTRKYDLSQLYDLSKLGKYTVYIEALNAFHSNGWKGGWVRSPTAKFEIVAPTQ